MTFTATNGNPFQKANRERINIRLALCGPTGSGKTYTSLGIATTLAKKMGGTRVAVIDTENRSADRYADVFDFDRVVLSQFSPESYEQMIHAAAAAKYGVLVIDSFSHAWDGPDGMLERVDQIAAQSRSGNTFQAWGKATPVFRTLIQTLLNFPGHLIVTMRSKMEYVLEENDRGKKEPRKVGMAPVMRAGVEYEFDVCADMDLDHTLIVTKSRCFSLANKVMPKPGPSFAESLYTWANQGEAPAPAPAATFTPAATPTTGEAKPSSETTAAPPAPTATPTPAAAPPKDGINDLDRARRKRCLDEFAKHFHGDNKAALEHASRVLGRTLVNSRSITPDEAQRLLDDVTKTYQGGSPATSTPPTTLPPTPEETTEIPPPDANREAMLDKIHALTVNIGCDAKDFAMSILGRAIPGPIFKLSDDDLIAVLNRLQEITAQNRANAGDPPAETHEPATTSQPATATVVEKITPTQILMKINTICRDLGAHDAEAMLAMVGARVGRKIFKLTELNGAEAARVATDLEYCKNHNLPPTASLDEIPF